MPSREDGSAFDGRLVVVELEFRQVGQVDREIEGEAPSRVLGITERRTPFVELPFQSYVLSFELPVRDVVLRVPGEVPERGRREVRAERQALPVRHGRVRLPRRRIDPERCPGPAQLIVEAGGEGAAGLPELGLAWAEKRAGPSAAPQVRHVTGNVLRAPPCPRLPPQP